ncbi:hypothetical protein BJF93_08035 [Xaviernesmea oryzae]|uniref:Uncharacterized protein n=2 Tax=Xaviernesmea oryzae TaxID=464029 RepID=A0A1Q9AWB9_9HYPH|nr:hypothetical protein BJF93_08035 [Xaviernesmea oryzae]
MSHGRLAALLMTEDGQATWFEEGQLAGEWKIEAIFADRVLVNFKDRRLTLSLYGNEGMNSNASTAAP